MNDEENPLGALRAEVDADATMDPAQADRLEARLRIAHGGARADTAVPAIGWRRPAVLASIAVALIAAFTLAIVAGDEAPSAALVITDAENVTVVLPDGTVVVDPADGFELPDGAIVEIGENGMVTIDEIVVDSPAVLSIRDGRLVADVAATTTTVDGADPLDPGPAATDPPNDTDPVTDAPATTSPPTAQPSTTRPSTTQAPSTRAPDRDRSDAEPSDPTPEGERGDPDDRRSDPTTTAPRAGDPESGHDREPGDERPADDAAPHPSVALALDLTRVETGIRVDWEVTGLEPGWSIVITRSIGERAPTTIVATVDAAGSVLDQPTGDGGQPVRRPLAYRVVVVDDAGGEVAAGPTQSLR